MCLDFSNFLAFGISRIGARPFLISRIADDTALLCNALHQPYANRSIARINKADIVLNLPQSLWIIINQEPEGFSQECKWIFGRRRRGIRRWQWIWQEYGQ